eukprot:7350527-Alexandrium_andersonii.AAC.1
MQCDTRMHARARQVRNAALHVEHGCMREPSSGAMQVRSAALHVEHGCMRHVEHGCMREQACGQMPSL